MLQNTAFANPTTLPVSGNDLDLGSQTKPRILIVDDDADTVGMMKLILRGSGFDVSGAHDHRSAVEKCAEVRPDIILLDLMMPEVDGYSTFTMLREVTAAPILFVSAAVRETHVVRSLELGAEDYITKPFHSGELVARVKRVLRKQAPARDQNGHIFPAISLEIDYEAREVSLRGRRIHLLPREFALLKILAERAPKNVPYEQITAQLWGEDTKKTRSHLKTIAFVLRRKLEEDPLRPVLLVNNRSVGYQLLTQS